MPLGVLILQRADPDAFRFFFGIFLVFWASYLLVRPHARVQKCGALADGFVGLTGGITGGAIAFPGALPSIWCAITRPDKETQRGTIQIFILVMQICTLAYLFAKGMVGDLLLTDYIKVIPAIIIGTFVGVHLFTKINEAVFRRIVLILLLVVGITHSIHAALDFSAYGRSGH